MAECDTGFAQIVGRHLHIHAITNADTDEIFAHFAGYVGQHLVSIRQCDAKHGSRQDLSHCPGQFYWFFFGQAIL